MYGPPRKIVHIDMDAYYASVEQRDDPRLNGKPVIVAWGGTRSVVCAASYEARKFGVRSAMPAAQAERLCPQAIFVPPDFIRYKAVSRQIRAIFSRHTDLIEPLSLDEAYLDVTVNKQGLGSATEVAKAIRASIRNELSLTASAGVAANKFLAKIASDWHKPNGLLVVRPHQAAAFLTSLPVTRLPGVGKVTGKRLAQIGIATVGELRTAPLPVLECRFGQWGRRLHELSLGIDERPVVTQRPALQVSAEDTFESDLRLDELEPHIRRLSEKTWRSYRKQPTRVARTIVLKLKTAQFKTLTRSLTLPTPPATATDVADIACGLRARVDLSPGTLYRLVGVGLAGLIDAGQFTAQADLFAGNELL
ncbi:DNA polymerase IV [Nitrococcus mobilis]|uniref:DNA polymerase IV n=1 Tax=Nitrococcus mobilis Nb-231 TaxID=314278 RepID=A4BTN7_9GAMM|nr:DNA polymerase IV [Nitrococcus mobilis]EAR20851.1 DNA polymerase IV [Nitrococcus mobilis Nb-231]